MAPQSLIQSSTAARQVAELLTMRWSLFPFMQLIEINFEEVGDMQTGLDDSHVAWWLAQDKQLVNIDTLARLQPTWACPICADGLEAESANGWIVKICSEAEAGTDSCPHVGHLY